METNVPSGATLPPRSAGLGNFNEAMAAYKKVIELSPGNEEAEVLKVETVT